MFDIHFLFGIFGNIIALVLFLVPSITFRKIIQNKSTEQFSGFPYVATFLNCLLSTWYGMPFVSPNNLPMSTVNGTGAVLELCYVILFICYIRDKKDRVPNGSGSALGALQLILYFTYKDWKKKKNNSDTSSPPPEKEGKVQGVDQMSDVEKGSYGQAKADSAPRAPVSQGKNTWKT